MGVGSKGFVKKRKKLFDKKWWVVEDLEEIMQKVITADQNGQFWHFKNLGSDLTPLYRTITFYFFNFNKLILVDLSHSPASFWLHYKQTLQKPTHIKHFVCFNSQNSDGV